MIRNVLNPRDPDYIGAPDADQDAADEVRSELGKAIRSVADMYGAHFQKAEAMGIGGNILAAKSRLEALIMATPSGPVRDQLCDANIALQMAVDAVRNARIALVNQP